MLPYLLRDALNILQKGPLIIIPILNVQVNLSKQNNFSDIACIWTSNSTYLRGKNTSPPVGLHDVDTRSIQGCLLVIDADDLSSRNYGQNKNKRYKELVHTFSNVSFGPNEIELIASYWRANLALSPPSSACVLTLPPTVNTFVL